MARDKNRIDLILNGRKSEGKAAGAILPGHALRVDGNGEYVVQNSNGAIGAERIIALEDRLQGKSVDDAYADDDTVFFAFPVPGDVLNVVIAASQTLVVGDKVCMNASGQFIKFAAQASIDAIILEATTTGVGVTALAAVRFI